MTFILIFACIITPYYVAFYDPDDEVYPTISVLLDIVFGVDMLVYFSSAYYDKDFKIRDKRLDIAIDYLRTWFITDLLAIFPFEEFFGLHDKENMTE